MILERMKQRVFTPMKKVADDELTEAKNRE